MEPLPKKGELPLYGHNDFQLLQEMAGQLEELGVLGKPEDYRVTAKHVSPSFLVKDARSGKTRFVTAFNILTLRMSQKHYFGEKCKEKLKKHLRH